MDKINKLIIWGEKNDEKKIIAVAYVGEGKLIIESDNPIVEKDLFTEINNALLENEYFRIPYNKNMDGNMEYGYEKQTIQDDRFLKALSAEFWHYPASFMSEGKLWGKKFDGYTIIPNKLKVE
jgi:hypothetical protein